jgi:hypothetical protein
MEWTPPVSPTALMCQTGFDHIGVPTVRTAALFSQTLGDQPENAVKSQIWIAVSVYVLVAIVKKRLKLDVSLYNTLLQIFSLALFEKMPIQQAFDHNNSISEQRSTVTH